MDDRHFRYPYFAIFLRHTYSSAKHLINLLQGPWNKLAFLRQLLESLQQVRLLLENRILIHIWPGLPCVPLTH
jgi:hypothetical protein